MGEIILSQSELRQVTSKVQGYFLPKPEQMQGLNGGLPAAFQSAKEELVGHLQAEIDRIKVLTFDQYTSVYRLSLTPDGLGAAFRLGVKVRIKDPEQFTQPTKDKVSRGRVGVISGFVRFSNEPIITFPPDGRRKEFKMGQCREKWLEVVE